MAEAKDHMVFHRSLTDLSNEIAGRDRTLGDPQDRYGVLGQGIGC
jgi:hypothetical protein